MSGSRCDACEIKSRARDAAGPWRLWPAVRAGCSVGLVSSRHPCGTARSPIPDHCEVSLSQRDPPVCTRLARSMRTCRVQPDRRQGRRAAGRGLTPFCPQDAEAKTSCLVSRRVHLGCHSPARSAPNSIARLDVWPEHRTPCPGGAAISPVCTVGVPAGSSKLPSSDGVVNGGATGHLKACLSGQLKACPRVLLLWRAGRSVARP
jgi:hypothetical protein